MHMQAFNVCMYMHNIVPIHTDTTCMIQDVDKACSCFYTCEGYAHARFTCVMNGFSQEEILSIYPLEQEALVVTWRVSGTELEAKVSSIVVETVIVSVSMNLFDYWQTNQHDSF